MSKYMVEAKSRSDLRNLARALRKQLQLDDELYFPIVELLDVMTELFEDFNYEIVNDKDMRKNVHADTDIRTGHIRIKESVYEGACNGEGRDRMTIAHEIGHYFTLCFCGFKLERNFGNNEIPAFRDPEWQAKCFAGELMVPAHLVKEMSKAKIAKQCGVSYDAACVQYKHL
ncbi:MAG: ImmA/IrrE family metallo-endopeptidase [Clostridiales bacterium]|nr:ImmA/IrrE family metallo-endopeptidase [Clostridiales bacterium]